MSALDRDWEAEARRYHLGVALRSFTLSMVVIDLLAIGAAFAQLTSH